MNQSVSLDESTASLPRYEVETENFALATAFSEDRPSANDRWICDDRKELWLGFFSLKV